jgi:DNA-binding MarR family transcriptional regulator
MGSPMNADSLDDLTPLILDVSRCLFEQADRMAQRRRILGPMYWPILVRLRRSPGLIQNELAALIGTTPMTITRLVDRLEAMKLVQRHHDDKDRRISRLILTRKADFLVREIARCQADLHHSMIEGIESSMLKTAHTALCNIKGNLTGARSSPKVLARGGASRFA